LDLANISFEEQQKLWAIDNRRDMSEYQADALDVGTTVDSLLRSESLHTGIDQDTYLDLLQQMGIEHLRQSGIRFLSSGQLRKVMITRALLRKQNGRTKLLLMDEPLETIDKQSQSPVSGLLNNWMDALNSTLLLCRREQDILPGCTHLAVMQGLEILQQGLINKVRETPEYQEIAKPKIDIQFQIPKQHESLQESVETVSPIRLVSVSAGYQSKLVLNNVSWQMDASHNTLIEGPNGCGKSTLLNLIDGENHKAYGKDVTLFGVKRGSGESVWDIKSHFGVISNEIHNKYVKGWKVLDVVVSGFFDSVGLYDNSGDSQVETARLWLDQLGVAALTKAFYHEISFGQQRLVLLARAMVKQPDVLILDEPCVGLDAYYRSLILNVVDAIAATTSTQIIFVSHTEAEAPSCINQHIQFVVAEGGGFKLNVS
jgi:molybdate transport system ATP-binding protein